MNDFDVIVVGGGPAGATAGAGCAQRGLRVALFERTRFPRHKVCGDVINPNCWPVLERLGVAERIRKLPHHDVDGALFAATGTHAITIPLPPETIAVRRDLFDTALLDHARACGVHVFENTTIHEISSDQRKVTAEEQYSARHGIIGADGRNSIVARKSGLTRRRRDGNGHIAFQSHFHAPKALDHRVQLHLFRGGYCGLVRVDADRVNLCIVTDQCGARHHQDCKALFAHTVWQSPRFRALGIAPEPIEPLESAHPLQASMNVPARDGVFLVGDALRVMEPFTGQGIFFALRTGELAVEAIRQRSSHEESYIAAVAKLYRQRGRTNELLRRALYHESAARTIVPVIHRAPRLARWLADNVLGGERRFR